MLRILKGSLRLVDIGEPLLLADECDLVAGADACNPLSFRPQLAGGSEDQLSLVHLFEDCHPPGNDPYAGSCHHDVLVL